jgi:uncharacterized protein
MRWSARATVHVLAILGALLATSPPALGQTIPPPPTAWVTDSADLLSPQTADGLNDELRSYERRTGHQILVYIAPTTGGVPIEDWAVSAFACWKVGRKGLDDGLVLFIFPRDHTVRIEVGYGLEPKVPDARAAEILRNTIEPGLRAGEADRAVTAGVAQIIVLAGNPPGARAEPSGDEAAPAPLSPIDLIAIGILLLIALAVAARSPWLALYLLVNIVGGRGGGVSGGGGFSGGGGRSGGGGASGRW